MRTRVLAIGAAVGLLVAGCGSSGSGSSDVAAVRSTLHQFTNDVSSGNYSGACSLLTSSAKNELSGANCPQLLAQGLKLDPSAKAQVQAAAGKIDKAHVSIKGNTATVSGLSGAPANLVKQNGRWMINSAGT